MAEAHYIGNKKLLLCYKVVFLASRKISTPIVLPTLDWAVEISKREDIAVVSGFHSRLERDVLLFLLKGKCGIIIILARGMYKRLSKQYEEAMNQNRLLIISYEKENIKRVSEITAHHRNDQVRILANETFTQM